MWALVRDDKVSELDVFEEDVLLQLLALAAGRLLLRLFEPLPGEPGDYIRLGRRPCVKRGGMLPLHSSAQIKMILWGIPWPAE